MTKRVMAKKFMRETGADKKTAMEYLRQCQWNYGYAKALYLAPQALADFADRITNIDWTAILKDIADAVGAVAERVAEILNSDEFHDACMAALEEARKEGGEE